MQRRFRATTRRRVLARVRGRLRTALDARRRRHVADVRFFELLSVADGTMVKRRGVLVAGSGSLATPD